MHSRSCFKLENLDITSEFLSCRFVEMDNGIHLSEIFGIQNQDPGSILLAFVFSMVWQLVDASLDEEGLLELTPNKKSKWPAGPHDMEIDLIQDFLQNKAMLVYDMTGRESFEHIPQWLEELRVHADKNVVFVMIGNKSDLEDQRSVPMEEAKEFAEKEGLLFLETSALDSTNVENSFITLLTEIFNTVRKKNLASRRNQGDPNKTCITGVTGGTISSME
ncbi:unnamed protein product [Thlaspi arvense]|uniref:Uncharacterized protein n=1 Tax=Thlaspi arvense TaxID=13288 RepID=A0AAU9SB17_THLAR|nr:unnamed protein product [Thlaspi arvense]